MSLVTHPLSTRIYLQFDGLNYAFYESSSHIYPLKPKLVYIIFKNSDRTAKRTQHFTTTNTSLLLLFEEIINVYTENHTEPPSIKCRFTDC
jgi:hypothetical protein